MSVEESSDWTKREKERDGLVLHFEVISIILEKEQVHFLKKKKRTYDMIGFILFRRYRFFSRRT